MSRIKCACGRPVRSFPSGKQGGDCRECHARYMLDYNKRPRVMEKKRLANLAYYSRPDIHAKHKQENAAYRAKQKAKVKK